MLVLQIKSNEMFDEEKQTFVDEEWTLKLEHSLASMSKWESVTEKPFLNSKDKTPEEALSYIKAMVIGDEPPPEVFQNLTSQHADIINAYINAKMTATWFADKPGAPGPREIITSELIYYWMIAHSIPFECERWHLNRLLTLIKVCNHKSAPKKKMSRRETAAQQSNLNAQRKARMGTRG